MALIAAARRHCSLPWVRVLRDMGRSLNVERYCGWGPYVAALLTRGLRLGGPGRAVSFGRGDTGWPLGAALVEAGRLPGFGRGASGSAPTHDAGSMETGFGWWRSRGTQLALLTAGSCAGLLLAWRARGGGGASTTSQWWASPGYGGGAGAAGGGALSRGAPTLSGLPALPSFTASAWKAA